MWLADFIYPRLCLHCDQQLVAPGNLCDPCGELLELVDSTGRCARCYRPKPGPICHPCHRSPFPWHGYARALAPRGPALKIRHCRPPLTEGMASFMVAQFFQQEWPTPDLVMTMPTPWWKRLRGPPPEVALAKRVATMISSSYTPFHTRVTGQCILLVHDFLDEEPMRFWGGELIKNKPSDLFALTFC